MVIADLIMKTNESYLAAQKAATELPEAHPIRLGLALNYSVFFYEIMKQHEEASKLAKEVICVTARKENHCEFVFIIQ